MISIRLGMNKTTDNGASDEQDIRQLSLAMAKNERRIDDSLKQRQTIWWTLGIVGTIAIGLMSFIAVTLNAIKILVDLWTR